MSGIINVWRPIRQTIRREPLAVCDASSIPEEDLREVRTYLPYKRKDSHHQLADVSAGEGFGTWTLVYNPDHRWYYASNMVPDEALLIKCFDSKLMGGREGVPIACLKQRWTKARQGIVASYGVLCFGRIRVWNRIVGCHFSTSRLLRSDSSNALYSHG